MAPYDSDSSGEDDYMQTNVLLGYTSQENTDGETVSRLGGRPEWLDETRPPSAALARCKICKGLMVLLLQLDGELPERFPGHERRLYVFSCQKKSCRRQEGSVRALRGVRITAQPVAASKPKQDDKGGKKETQPAVGIAGSGLGEALFGVKSVSPPSSLANPFATSTSSCPSPAIPANPFATSKPAASTSRPQNATPEEQSPVNSRISNLPKSFAETLNLNTDQSTHGPPPLPEPWPPNESQPSPYTVRYLSEAAYETLDPNPAPKLPATKGSMDELDQDGRFSGNSRDDKEDKIVFESSMDSVFQKFADRMAQNPEQAIRYEFGGEPLLYSKDDMVGKMLHDGKQMPPCQNCGSGRVFEVQLTPHAITELEADDIDLDGMEWGTIIVGVCGQDCQKRTADGQESGYLEEFAGVQWEELKGARR